MDALVMCGGPGTRLQARIEKPLVDVDGKPMIERVYHACLESDIDQVFGVVSPQTPTTEQWLSDRDVPIIITPGDGYVADLQLALQRVGTPVITVAADLPLLIASHIDTLIDEYDGPSITGCVPTEVKAKLDLSVDTTITHGTYEYAPVGLNIVADCDDEAVYVFSDDRIAVNVNRPTDIEIAEGLA